MKDRVELLLPSTTRYLHAARSLTLSFSESIGFERSDAEKAALAVEEAIANVLEHSYHGEEGHQVRVIYEFAQNKLTIRVLDQGDQADPIDAGSEPEMSNFYRQKKRGGLGIVIMKKFMDEVTYKQEDQHNECCMVKYLPNAR